MSSYGELGAEGELTEESIAWGPGQLRPEKLHLFGQFIGSWSVSWTDRGSEREREAMQGEVHFAWLLGGQAVQDVWTVPSDRGANAVSSGEGIRGTTIRFFDPSFDTWRCTWIEPSKGVIRQFFGWSEGDDIILFSDDEKPYVRWNFTKILKDSFFILRENSSDRGQTWEIEEEMWLSRIVSD